MVNCILRYDSDNGKIQTGWLPLTNLISESYSITVWKKPFWNYVKVSSFHSRKKNGQNWSMCAIPERVLCGFDYQTHSPPLPCDLRLNSLQVSVNSLDYFFMFFNTRDQRLSVETTDEEQKDACQAWGLLTAMSLRSPEPQLDPLGLCFCKACL